MESDASRRRGCLRAHAPPSPYYKIVGILVSFLNDHFKILEKIRNTSPTTEKSKEQLKEFTLKWNLNELKDQDQMGDIRVYKVGSTYSPQNRQYYPIQNIKPGAIRE